MQIARIFIYFSLAVPAMADEDEIKWVRDPWRLQKQDIFFLDTGEFEVIRIVDAGNVILKSGAYSQEAGSIGRVHGRDYYVWLSHYDTSRLVPGNKIRIEQGLRYLDNEKIEVIEERVMEVVTRRTDSTDGGTLAVDSTGSESGEISDRFGTSMRVTGTGSVELDATRSSEVRTRSRIDYETETFKRNDNAFLFEAMPIALHKFTAKSGATGRGVIVERTRRAVLIASLIEEEGQPAKLVETLYAIRDFAPGSIKVIMAVPIATPPPRLWVDVTGKFRVEAYYDAKRIRDSKVTLIREDTGAPISVPVVRLSEDDREWLLEYNKYLNEEPENPQRDMAIKMARARYAAIRRQRRLAKEEASAEAFFDKRNSTIMEGRRRAGVGP